MYNSIFLRSKISENSYPLESHLQKKKIIIRWTVLSLLKSSDQLWPQTHIAYSPDSRASHSVCTFTHKHTHVHIPGQKQHTSLSENLWMEKWFNTLGGAAGLPTLLCRTRGTICTSLCRFVHLSVCVSVRHCICISTLSVCLLFDCFIITICLHVWLPGCLFFYLFTCHSVSVSVCLCFCVTLYLSVCLSESTSYVSVYLSLYLFFQLQYWLSVFFGDRSRQLHLFHCVCLSLNPTMMACISN